MKKYITPEVEIKRFAVENIMTSSTPVTPVQGSASVVTNPTDAADVTASVSYNKLFGLE